MVIHIEFDVIKLAFAKLTVSLGNTPPIFSCKDLFGE